MLASELPTHLLKPYAKSRVNQHVQTIAFVQLVKRGDMAQAVDLALCENVVTSRTRDGNRSWTRHVDQKYDSHSKAVTQFLYRFAEAQKKNFICLTSTGIFLPMNNTDLRHFRSSSSISRAALEYGTALFDEIARWYSDEQAKAGSSAPSSPRPATPPPAPVPPPVAPSVLSAGTPAESAAKGDDFAMKLLELEETLKKIEES